LSARLSARLAQRSRAANTLVAAGPRWNTMIRIPRLASREKYA
jgi:hypothetical protein